MSETSQPFDRRAPAVRGLLQTVGGTAEPIVFTICQLRPAAVVLLCSEDSLSVAVEVKRRVREELAEDAPEFTTVPVADPTDLVACHRAAAEGLQSLGSQFGLTRDEVRIDFTGGTKAMSAAAVLAAAPDGYGFVYVSGRQRNKNGLGIVVTGSEEVCLPDNPWTILEEPELRRLLDMAAEGQWAAALDSAGKLLQRSTESSEPLFQALHTVVEGLRAWDRFEQPLAWQKWQKGTVIRRLHEMAQVTQRPLVLQFAARCQPLVSHLALLAEVKEGKTTLKRDALVLDMLANGDRQAERGNYDEAALRYYRAVELAARRVLILRYQIDNSAVKAEDVPPPLREEFRQRKGEPTPCWKLGLYESAQLLAAKNDPLGTRLLSHLDALDSEARNQNWLIHGDQHVDQGRFAQFKRHVLDALDIRAEDVPRWPDFRP